MNKRFASTDLVRGIAIIVGVSAMWTTSGSAAQQWAKKVGVVDWSVARQYSVYGGRQRGTPKATTGGRELVTADKSVPAKKTVEEPQPEERRQVHGSRA